MPSPKKFLVPNTPVQGRIKGTTDYGFTEALGNWLQPGVKNPGIGQAFRNWLNEENYRGQIPARPAGMNTAQPAAEYDRNREPSRYPPITSPNTTFQNADDEYNRLISQYGPSGIEQLSGMTSLPTGFTPTGSNKPASLKDYYTAQTLQGSAGMGNIISAMGYKGDMAKWAQANPMLAQREFSKRFGGATLGSAVQPDGSVRGMPQAIPGLDTSKMMPTAEMQGTAFPGQGQGPTFNPVAFTDQSNFSTPANAVPAPPTQQGMAVSAPYAAAQRQAAEKTAGATGMPNFQTTPEAQDPGMNFLDAFKKNPQFDAYRLGAGARLGDYFQGIR